MIQNAFTFYYQRILDLEGKKDYLHRWSFGLPFGLSLKIHKIVRADNDRCEHDHPWWFVRLIMYGGYSEVIKGVEHKRLPWRPWAFWRIYPCVSSFQHRITQLYKKENWSLVLCGPHRGTWGFITKKGWVEWTKFLGSGKKKVVLWCKDMYKGEK